MFNEEIGKVNNEILRSGMYVNLQSDEAMEMDLVYLTYRAERDLYSWRQRQNPDPAGFWGCMSWEEYISFLRSTPILLTAACLVMGTVLLSVQPDQFDFSPHKEEPLFKISDSTDDDLITLAQLFPSTKDFPAVQLLMLQAQRGYYPYIKKMRGPLYAWETYVAELLMRKEEINEPLLRGFQYTLTQIDFTEQWAIVYPLIQNDVEESPP